MKNATILEGAEEVNKVFYGKSFVAFLDILGFKSLVRNNTHEELIEIYKSLVMNQVTGFLDIQEKLEQKRKDDLKDLFRSNKVRVVNISDSIILWTKDTKLPSLYSIIKAVKVFMASSMSLGIPLRGSIVKGDVAEMENNNTFSLIGKGIVKAYEREGIQNWSGCTIEEAIIKHLDSINKVVLQKGKTNIEANDWLVVRYPVPIKGDNTKEELVVNWITSFNDIKEEGIKDAFYDHEKMKGASPALIADTNKKIENTVQFVQHCLKIKGTK